MLQEHTPGSVWNVAAVAIAIMVAITAFGGLFGNGKADATVTSQASVAAN